MSRDHRRTYRPGRRAFRPSLDGRLESRLLLTGRTGSGVDPFFMHPGTMTINGGQAVLVDTQDHQLFRISVSDGAFRSNGPTIRGHLRRDGSIDLTVYGSTVNTVLEVDPIEHPIRFQRDRHVFPTGTMVHSGLLNIHSINVVTGNINSILGYQTAELSGPITSMGTTAIDRIALFSIEPGGSIQTGGDVNTLDIFQNATLSNGPGLIVGRDLNWLVVGGDITIDSGAAFATGRDIGLTNQPPKGSDLGGQGGTITGNIVVNPGGAFVVGRSIDALVGVKGSIFGASHIVIPNGGNNLVALGGIFAGVPQPPAS
jgi:hypothetical protein